MKITVNQRIGLIIESRKMNLTSFSKLIGVAQTSLRDCVKNGAEPKYSTLNKILIANPLISPEWLLTGNGEMLKSETPLIDYNNKEPLSNNQKGSGINTSFNGKFHDIHAAIGGNENNRNLKMENTQLKKEIIILKAEVEKLRSDLLNEKERLIKIMLKDN